jgi:hypothetical protein
MGVKNSAITHVFGFGRVLLNSTPFVCPEKNGMAKGAAGPFHAIP